MPIETANQSRVPYKKYSSLITAQKEDHRVFGRTGMQAASGFMRVVSTTSKELGARKTVTSIHGNPKNGELPYKIEPREIIEKAPRVGGGPPPSSKKKGEKKEPAAKAVQLSGVCSTNLQRQWIQQNVNIKLDALPENFADFDTSVRPLLTECCKQSSAISAVLNSMDVRGVEKLENYRGRGGDLMDRGLPAMFSFTLGGPKHEMRYDLVNFAAYSLRVQGLQSDDEVFNRTVWIVVGPRYSTSPSSSKYLSPSIGVSILWGGEREHDLERARVHAQITLTPTELVAVDVDWVPQERDHTWLNISRFTKLETYMKTEKYLRVLFNQSKKSFMQHQRRDVDLTGTTTGAINNVVLDYPAPSVDSAYTQLNTTTIIAQFLKRVKHDDLTNIICKTEFGEEGVNVYYYQDQFRGGPMWYSKYAPLTVIAFVKSQLQLMYQTHLMKMVVFVMTMDCLRLEGLFGTDFQLGRRPKLQEQTNIDPRKARSSRLQLNDMMTAIMAVFAPEDWIKKEGDVSTLENTGEFWWTCQSNNYKRVWPKLMREVMYMWHIMVGLFPFGHSLQRDMTTEDHYRMQLSLVLILDQLIGIHAKIKCELAQKHQGDITKDTAPVENAALKVLTEIQKEVETMTTKHKSTRAVIENKLSRLKFHLDPETGKTISLDTYLRKDNTFNLHSARLNLPILSQDFEINFNMSRSVGKILPYYAEMQELFLPYNIALSRARQTHAIRKAPPPPDHVATLADTFHRQPSSSMEDEDHGEPAEIMQQDNTADGATAATAATAAADGDMDAEFSDEADEFNFAGRFDALTLDDGGDYFGTREEEDDSEQLDGANNDPGQDGSKFQKNSLYQTIQVLLDAVKNGDYESTPRPTSDNNDDDDVARLIGVKSNDLKYVEKTYTPTDLYAQQGNTAGLGYEQDGTCYLPLALDLGSRVVQIHVERHRIQDSFRGGAAKGGGGGGSMEPARCCYDKKAPQLPIPSYQLMVDKMQLDRVQNEELKKFSAVAKAYRLNAKTYRDDYWRAIYAGIDNWLLAKNIGRAGRDRTESTFYIQNASTSFVFRNQDQLNTIAGAIKERFKAVAAASDVCTQTGSGGWIIRLPLDNTKTETRWGGEGPTPEWTNFVLLSSPSTSESYWAMEYDFGTFGERVGSTDRTRHHDFAGMVLNASEPTAPQIGLGFIDLNSARNARRWKLHSDSTGYALSELNVDETELRNHDNFWVFDEKMEMPLTSLEPAPPMGSMQCNFGGYLHMAFPPRSSMGIFIDSKSADHWTTFYDPPRNTQRGVWSTNSQAKNWSLNRLFKAGSTALSVPLSLNGPNWYDIMNRHGNNGTRGSTWGNSSWISDAAASASAANTHRAPVPTPHQPSSSSVGGSGHKSGSSVSDATQPVDVLHTLPSLHQRGAQRVTPPPVSDEEQTLDTIDVTRIFTENNITGMAQLTDEMMTRVHKRRRDDEDLFSDQYDYRIIQRGTSGEKTLVPFQPDEIRDTVLISLSEYDSSLFNPRCTDLPYDSTKWEHHNGYHHQYICRAIIKFYGVNVAGKKFFDRTMRDSSRRRVTTIAIQRIFAKIKAIHPRDTDRKESLRVFQACKEITKLVGDSKFNLYGVYNYNPENGLFAATNPEYLESLYHIFPESPNNGLPTAWEDTLFRTDTFPIFPDYKKDPSSMFENYVREMVIFFSYHGVESRERFKAMETKAEAIREVYTEIKRRITTDGGKHIPQAMGVVSAAVDKLLAELPPPPTPAGAMWVNPDKAQARPSGKPSGKPEKKDRKDRSGKKKASEAAQEAAAAQEASPEGLGASELTFEAGLNPDWYLSD